MKLKNKNLIVSLIVLSLFSCNRKKESNVIDNYAVEFKWRDSLEIINDITDFDFETKNSYNKEKTSLFLLKKLDSILIENTIKQLSKEDSLIADEYLKKNYFSKIYKWKIRNENINIFFVVLNSVITGEGIYVFASKNDKITNKPFFYGKWIDENNYDINNRWLTKPLVSYHDINGDNKKELVLKEQVHNGSVYDAVIIHYLNVNESLEIKDIIHLETIARINNDSQNYIERIPEFKANDLRLLSLLKSIKDKSTYDTLGLTTFEMSPMIKIKNIKVLNGKFKDLLITSSSENNDTILLNGYKNK